MKFLIPLVVLCTAFFVVSESDAAPVLPSAFKLTETARAMAKEQQLDEWAKTFLSTYSKFFTSARDRDEISRDGSIQADAELKQPTFPRNFLSPLGYGDGEAQSDDEEMMQTLFGTLLSKSIDNGGVYVQSDKNKKLKKTFLKAFYELISSVRENSNPNDEVSQIILDGTISILTILQNSLDEDQPAADENEIQRILFDTIDNGLSALERNADPNDEMTHTMINAFKICIPLVFRKEVENEGIIQSSDSEMNRPLNFMNFLGKIQSDSKDTRAFLNAMNALFGTFCKYTSPNNEIAKAFCDFSDIFFSFIGKTSSNEKNQSTDEEIMNKFISHFNNIISVMVKRIENGKIQSPDCTGEANTAQQWGAFLDSLGSYKSIC